MIGGWKARLMAAIFGVGAAVVVPEATATGDGPHPSPQGPGALPTIGSLDDLVRLDPAMLDTLYRHSPPATIPRGKVRGRPVVLPGSTLAVPASRAGRAIWQGKVFDPESGVAVNRFFGVRAIRGELSYGPSWLDGGPALILDYERTSRVYGRYRDELREVAPGLVLGLMYERTRPVPTKAMYFALDYGANAP